MRIVVATGATSGCGLAVIKNLVARDDGPYTVIVGSRRPEHSKSEATAKGVLSCCRGAKTTVIHFPLDLTSLESVKKFAALVKENLAAEIKIDILLLCAGMGTSKRTALDLPNGDKIDETLVVNSIAQVFLTRCLLSSLTPSARVTIVTSWIHRRAPDGEVYCMRKPRRAQTYHHFLDCSQMLHLR